MKLNNNNSWFVLLIISLVVLLLSYDINLFHAVNPSKFDNFQHDSESLVIGRLVRSYSDGINSSESRLGRFHGLPGDTNQNQTILFLKDDVGGHYKPYNSQIGLQGILFSNLDRFLSQYKITPDNRLRIYHFLSSFLFSLSLSIIIVIFYFELGIEAALVLLLSIALSKWPVYFAKNLYWLVSTMFMPMLIVFVYLKLNERKFNIPIFIPLILVFLFVFIKSTMGYEYISCVLLSTISPIIYYSIKNNWSKSLLFTRIFYVGAFGLAGFVLALFTHINQLENAFNDRELAIDTIKERVLARTQTEPETYLDTPYYESQKVSYVYVLYKQLTRGGSFRLKIPFFFWILFFAYISYKLLTGKEFIKDKNEIRTNTALIYATWFSLLAPLSWIILAKSHSYIHTYINNIVWYLPFMIFGFALVGVYWRPKIKKLLNRN